MSIANKNFNELDALSGILDELKQINTEKRKFNLFMKNKKSKTKRVTENGKK